MLVNPVGNDHQIAQVDVAMKDRIQFVFVGVAGFALLGEENDRLPDNLQIAHSHTSHPRLKQRLHLKRKAAQFT